MVFLLGYRTFHDRQIGAHSGGSFSIDVCYMRKINPNHIEAYMNFLTCVHRTHAHTRSAWKQSPTL